MLNITPLYVIVPGKECELPCAHCLARKYKQETGSCLDETSSHYSICKQDFYNRMSFARDIGCNALFLIGDCEPQKNRVYLERIALVNNSLQRPYRILELTTSGRGLNKEYLYFLRSVVNITTIDLNIASFDDEQNQELAGMSEEDKIFLLPLTQLISDLRFNLHSHIFLSNYFDKYERKPEQFFRDCQTLYGADYLSIHSLPAVNGWLEDRRANPTILPELHEYVKARGKPMDSAIFMSYNKIYALDNMMVIVDTDPVDKIPPQSLVLHPDGRLYSQWQNSADLIF